MASFALVTDMQTGQTRFAIAASDKTVRYVFPEGRQIAGLDGARIMRLVKRRRPDAPPLNTAEAWMRLAASNIGYYHVGAPEEAATIDDAQAAAASALASNGTQE